MASPAWAFLVLWREIRLRMAAMLILLSRCRPIFSRLMLIAIGEQLKQLDAVSGIVI